MPANAVARRAAGWIKGIPMKRSVIAVCAVMSLGLAGCSQNPQERGALRGGGIGAAAGALASLFVPGLGILGGMAIGGIGGAGVGAATSKGKSYHHSESPRYPVDANGNPAEQVPAEPAPEAPPGG
jgi:hypothetical protein